MRATKANFLAHDLPADNKTPMYHVSLLEKFCTNSISTSASSTRLAVSEEENSSFYPSQGLAKRRWIDDGWMEGWMDAR